MNLIDLIFLPHKRLKEYGFAIAFKCVQQLCLSPGMKGK